MTSHLLRPSSVERLGKTRKSLCGKPPDWDSLNKLYLNLTACAQGRDITAADLSSGAAS
jgi:hypothetical protein